MQNKCHDDDEMKQNVWQAAVKIDIFLLNMRVKKNRTGLVPSSYEKAEIK